MLLAGMTWSGGPPRSVAGPVVEAELAFPFVSAAVDEAAAHSLDSAVALPESHEATSTPAPPAQVAEPEPSPEAEPQEIVADAAPPEPMTAADNSAVHAAAAPMAGQGGDSAGFDRRLRLLALRRALREQQPIAQSGYTPGHDATVLGTGSQAEAASHEEENDRFTLRLELPVDAPQTQALADYEAALADLIFANWVAPEATTETVPCYFTILPLPSPMELQVDDTCPFDEATRQSIKDAFAMAQPQPRPPQELLALVDAMRVVMQAAEPVPASVGN